MGGANSLRGSSNGNNLPPQPQRLNFNSNNYNQKMLGNLRYAANSGGGPGSQVSSGVEDPQYGHQDQKFEPQDEMSSNYQNNDQNAPHTGNMHDQ